MKILFLNPPSQSVYGLPRFPTMGLIYLGTALKKKGIKVEILDMRLPRNNLDVLRQKIVLYKPNFIGVSSTTADYPAALKLFSFIKRKNPRIKTILGGPQADVCTELLKNEKRIDYLFLGEGEDELPKFLLKNNAKAKIINSRRIFPQDLDKLPFPDWSLVCLDDYKVRGKLILPVLTSRGCPFSCLYCSSWRTHGKAFRFRSPRNVVDEMEVDLKNYGAKNFSILDDNFALDVKRAEEICQEIIRRKLHINWTCDQGMRADRGSLKLFRLMKKSGCDLVAFGVEHADQVILNQMQKNESVETIKESIGLAKKAGLIVKAFFIVGGPGDSLEMNEKSINFFKENNVDIPRFSMMTAYPGSAMWQWVEKNGRFIGDPYKRIFKKPPDQIEVQFVTDNFSQDERKLAYLRAEKESELWIIRMKLKNKIGFLSNFLFPIFRLSLVRKLLKFLYKAKLISATD